MMVKMKQIPPGIDSPDQTDALDFPSAHVSLYFRFKDVLIKCCHWVPLVWVSMHIQNDYSRG